LLWCPVAPKPLRNLGLGLLLGLLVGVGLAVLRERLDTTVKSNAVLTELTSAPTLGTVVFDPSAKRAPLVAQAGGRSPRSEAFRQLRTNLQFINVDQPPRVVVVTSSVPDEGKSSTAVNLAMSIAQAGRTVLLVEGDLRRPRAAEYLGLEGAVGLTNVLVGQVGVDDVLQPWGVGGLWVLPSGSIPPNPSELLASQNMIELLDSLRTRFDVVVIDSPPLLPVTDGAVTAARADGALLVVRYGSTTRAQVSAAAAALHAVDAKLLGCVMNMVSPKDSEAYSYAYDYSYEDETPSRPRLDASRNGASADAPGGLEQGRRAAALFSRATQSLR